MNSTDGYTLLETLVAFALLSISLATFYTGIGYIYRGFDRANLAMQAGALAQNELSNISNGLRPIPHIVEGVGPRGLTWQLRTTPLQRFSKNSRLPTRPYRAEFVSRSSSGKVVYRVRTIVIGPVRE